MELGKNQVKTSTSHFWGITFIFALLVIQSIFGPMLFIYTVLWIRSTDIVRIVGDGKNSLTLFLRLSIFVVFKF